RGRGEDQDDGPRAPRASVLGELLPPGVERRQPGRDLRPLLSQALGTLAVAIEGGIGLERLDLLLARFEPMDLLLDRPDLVLERLPLAVAPVALLGLGTAHVALLVARAGIGVIRRDGDRRLGRVPLEKRVVVAGEKLRMPAPDLRDRRRDPV